MKVQCECGKQLSVPDSLAGKQVKCPACARVFKAPSPASASAAAAKAGRAIVGCACGKQLSAPASAAGKQVRCPACGATVAVPVSRHAPDAGPAPDEEELGFELDSPPHPPEPEEDDASTYGVTSSQCPNCSAELEAAAQVCVACGTYLATGTRMNGIDMKVVHQRKTVNRRMHLLIGGGIAAVLIIAGVTLAFVGFDKLPGRKKSGTPANAVAPEPEQSTDTEKPRKFGPPPLEKKPNEGYLEIVAYAPGRAQAKVDTIAVNQLVRAFEIEYSRYPKDIEELKRYGQVPELTTGLEYEYNPETGEVKIVRTKDKVRSEAGEE